MIPDRLIIAAVIDPDAFDVSLDPEWMAQWQPQRQAAALRTADAVLSAFESQGDAT